MEPTFNRRVALTRFWRQAFGKRAAASQQQPTVGRGCHRQSHLVTELPLGRDIDLVHRFAAKQSAPSCTRPSRVHRGRRCYAPTVLI
jgi:hypothetical protein